MTNTIITKPFKLQTLRGLTVTGPVGNRQAHDLSIKYNLSLITQKSNRLHVFTGHGSRLNALQRELTR
jgi:hypothetical protein